MNGNREPMAPPPARRAVIWMLLATTFSVAAGIDTYLAITVDELWPGVLAGVAALAGVGCLILATRERRRGTRRISRFGG